MKDIVLYCKTFARDLNRVINLLDSIEKFNMDNIPVYISIPKDQINYFAPILDRVNLLFDEDVYTGNAPGWKQQQIVKASFWKSHIANNYVCLDSDSYFIRPFYKKDFMYDNITPYTVIHEQKELFSWSVGRTSIIGFDPKTSFINDKQIIMNIFGRQGKYYDFGPVPTIWSSKVWRDLENNYLKPNNLTFEHAIEYCPSEFSWYGEALLEFKSIPIYPSEPLFKVFHYLPQYIEYKKQGITEEMIAQNYLGIVMQSNFNANLKYA